MTPDEPGRAGRQFPCLHERVRLIWQMNPLPAAVECLDCHGRWSIDKQTMPSEPTP